MTFEIVVIALGLLFIVLVMAFVMNPPEAWIKKFFRVQTKRDSSDTDKLK
jgi:multisubunit Na+/H+ antiporter MnhB subunit